MKKLLIIISITLLPIFFTACSTKSQNDVLTSSKDDVSTLLDKLIQKEKEINQLTKKLEDCKDKRVN